MVAAVCGWWGIACWLLALRLAVALLAAGPLLNDVEALRHMWALPARDLWGAAVWVAGMVGRKVEWGGRQINLTADGRIRPQ